MKLINIYMVCIALRGFDSLRDIHNDQSVSKLRLERGPETSNVCKTGDMGLYLQAYNAQLFSHSRSMCLSARREMKTLGGPMRNLSVFTNNSLAISACHRARVCIKY